MAVEIETLKAYVKAVFSHWWAIVTGLALTVLDGIERLFGTWYIAPRWAKVATGVAGLVVAQYQAYRDLARSTPDSSAAFKEQLRTVFREAELEWHLIDMPDSPVVTPETICTHVDDFCTELTVLYSQCPPSWDSRSLREVIEKLHATKKLRIGKHVGSIHDAERICDQMKVALADIRAMLQ
jgi:hypothetical protein